MRSSIFVLFLFFAIGIQRAEAKTAQKKIECKPTYSNQVIANSLKPSSREMCKIVDKTRQYFKQKWGKAKKESELDQAGKTILNGIKRLLVRLDEDSQLNPPQTFSARAADAAVVDCKNHGGIVKPVGSQSEIEKTLWLARDVYCQPSQGQYQHVHAYTCLKCTE